MMVRRRSFFAAAIVLMLGASAPVAVATEPGRVLNGHTFLPSEVIPTPFAVSQVATRTGGGLAFDLKTPFIDLDGQSLGTLEGDVAFMSLGFRYQHRFGDWFAARASFGGTGRIGIDEQSILAQGVSGVYSFGIGATARILQTEKTILSGAMDFSDAQVVGVDPFGFAERIVQDGLGVEDNSLVESGSSYSGRATVLGGWAPWDWLGLTGFVEAGRGGIDSGDPHTSIGGGALAGVDFKNLDLIPVGVHIVAATDAFSEAGAGLTNRSWKYGLGLSYTGWSDFVLGLETSMAVLERQGEGDDFTAFIMTFNLSYWP